MHAWTQSHTHTHSLADQPLAFHSVESARLQMPRNLLPDQMLASTGAGAKTKQPNSSLSSFCHSIAPSPSDFLAPKKQIPLDSVVCNCRWLSCCIRRLFGHSVWCVFSIALSLSLFFINISILIFFRRHRWCYCCGKLLLVATIESSQSLCVCVCLFVIFFWQQYLLRINKILAYKMNILL